MVVLFTALVPGHWLIHLLYLRLGSIFLFFLVFVCFTVLL